MANRRASTQSPSVCPVCGENVPRGSLACPDCGADHRSGWREDASVHDGLDLPEEEFDYDAFVREEFGSTVKPAGIKPVWWITGLVLTAALVAIYLFGFR